MNKNTQSTQVEQELMQETGNMQDQADFQKRMDITERRFGIADIWRIRKSSRGLRIHNRMPRL